MNVIEYGKRVGIVQYYVVLGVVSSFVSLSIFVQFFYNVFQELLIFFFFLQGQFGFGGQLGYGGQFGFIVGSFIFFNGFFRYM